MKVRSKQQGEALQFTGGRESASDLSNLVGSLGKLKHRPARSGASPAIPVQPESVYLSLDPLEGQRVRQSISLSVGDWIVKTQNKITAYTDAGFRTFWEPATTVEQKPADANQEQTAPDPDQEVTSDEVNDEPEGSNEGEGRSEAAGDERDVDPPDPGDLLQDEEGPVDLADEVGEPGEVGGAE